MKNRITSQQRKGRVECHPQEFKGCRGDQSHFILHLIYPSGQTKLGEPPFFSAYAEKKYILIPDNKETKGFHARINFKFSYPTPSIKFLHSFSGLQQRGASFFLN